MSHFWKLLLLIMVLGNSCQDEKNLEAIEKYNYTPIEYTDDPHSFSNPKEAVITHLDLDVDVDFEKQIVYGTATYTIYVDQATSIILDTKDLTIKGVLADGHNTTYALGEGDEILGQPLEITIEESTKEISIQYSTSIRSEALQWLKPEQTANKTHPFLYTQGQPILTRSWIPIQDSPQIRITYNARVDVPRDLMALMSAENPIHHSKDGRYNFRMEQPIPAYLIVLAVGNLEYRSLSFRTGVYAEPSVIEHAKNEFEDMEEMIQITELLYGKYQWEQYDLLILPPSFPYGGMENPRLSFISPTVIAGDKSLTSVIAHELAHSWSGNLVTNASWNDFWLNEGFTVYVENRIMEELYGEERANLLALISRQDLEKELEQLKDREEDTALKLNLKHRDPDDGMNGIAYEKGFLLLKTLEEKVGRGEWDLFLNTYFNRHSFSSISTEQFVDYLKQRLLQPHGIDFNIDEWVYEAGIPANEIELNSTAFEVVSELRDGWIEGQTIYVDKTTSWSPQEWVYFISNLPVDLDLDTMRRLDEAFTLTHSTNSYILMNWYEQAIIRDYHQKKIDQKIEDFLINIGRSWYVTTLYKAFVKAGKTDIARQIYVKARPNYHSVTQQRVDAILKLDAELQ